MGLMMKLSLLVATLCVLQVYGYDKEDEYMRALQTFRLMQREHQQEEQQRALEDLETLEDQEDLEERMILHCKEKREGCNGIPKCCGSLQCYWKDGYSMRTRGVCVECVQQDQLCQRDSTCCPGLVCDKGNPLWVDGRCVAPREAGSCYRDKQCVGSCSRRWYQVKGNCVSKGS